MSRNLNIFWISLSYTAALLLVLLHCQNSFFWDTVQLGSKHADFYYQNHLSSLILPVTIDSGHIPTFGIYIATCWQLFGRSLAVSHLAMLPFALGIVFQLYRLCRKYIAVEFAGLALVMVLGDPSLLSQMTLVSPDVCLVFFFLWGWNAVLENKKLQLTVAIACLFLTSMRGMMVSLCLLGLDIYLNTDLKTSVRKIVLQLFKRSLLYLPALLLFVAYNAYHFQQVGWIGFHEDSPWAESFEKVDHFKGFLFNIALYGWRLLDFGRIGIWVIGLSLIVVFKKNLYRSRDTSILLFFTLGMMVVLPLNMLWAKNLMGYRYLIPVYLCISLVTASLLFSSDIRREVKYALSALWMLCLIGGNFIIYPDKIAKGWDSTLAHLPYYQLRHQAIDYLDQEKIDFNNVTSFFPNTSRIDQIDLNSDQRNFNQYNGKTDYVLYSNIYNVDDATYDSIQNPQLYTVQKQFEDRGVFIQILRKNN